MRDLYRALGLSGIEADRPSIERALARPGCPVELREAARFVLLDASRKARYDWVLSRGRELSAVRSSLGLAEDPGLSNPPRAFETPARAPVRGQAHASARGFRRTGWAVAGLILVALIVGIGMRAARVVPGAEVTAPGQGLRETRPRPAGESAPRAEELAPMPPPDHGWLQLGPEIRPTVSWRIDTEPGQDYVLTLLDAKSQALALTLYLRGGETYQGLAPEGSFELAYVTGSHWYGQQQGFGPGAKQVKPGLTYQVQAGPAGDGSWKLRLNPNACEGMPSVPKPASSPNPAPAGADPSL
ncbi:hypothetical protein GETHLI_16370 [Geothrix limicola]|uniref:J domain-containing protein n=1 Tax=Geothrix limicola TaxID=2927978 RepID=A0ABQ5QE66_9BACT|nr:hypothetical protein [Geothrix limicola]GLH73135.1 hypothetical protein GETHLI_16370 [Geothrix limicola]